MATPNQVHVQNGLEAVAAGLPALIEKPIADDIEAATRLVEAAEAARIPLLTGHHRRHNPMIRKAKAVLDDGRLGRVLVAHAMFWLFKPDDYFDAGWRRAAGGGPVFLNLIHDVDNLRYLLGDVATVPGAGIQCDARPRGGGNVGRPARIQERRSGDLLGVGCGRGALELGTSRPARTPTSRARTSSAT